MVTSASGTSSCLKSTGSENEPITLAEIYNANDWARSVADRYAAPQVSWGRLRSGTAVLRIASWVGAVREAVPALVEAFQHNAEDVAGVIETPSAGRPLAGEVLAITSLTDIQKNTLQVKVTIDDPPDRVKPDMLVQVTDFDQPNGVSGLGKRVSLTQQILLKYAVVF